MIGYIHCKNCYGRGGGDILDVGIKDPQTLEVECAVCRQSVGTFKLAEPLQNLACEVCNAPLGPGHIH